jgi:hypothetical protein
LYAGRIGSAERRKPRAALPTHRFHVSNSPDPSDLEAVIASHWVGGNADKSSLPGLTRQSIFFEKYFLRRWMDARIKSGHDECVLCAHQS